MARGTERPVLELAVAALPDGRTEVNLAGELDLSGSPGFCELVIGHLQTSSVVLDLAGLTFMDSSGVRALNTLLREADAVRGELAVRADFAESVAQLLRMTGMLELLPLEVAA